MLRKCVLVVALALAGVLVATPPGGAVPNTVPTVSAIGNTTTTYSGIAANYMKTCQTIIEGKLLPTAGSASINDLTNADNGCKMAIAYLNAATGAAGTAAGQADIYTSATTNNAWNFIGVVYVALLTQFDTYFYGYLTAGQLENLEACIFDVIEAYNYAYLSWQVNGA